MKSGRELRRALDRVEMDGEHEARERAWNVVRAAWETREPSPRERATLRPLLVAAALAAIGAAAFTPPGRAVVDSVREAIGLEAAEPALFSLPADGRVLVTSARGSWVVQRDGSRRLLGPFREASWSPYGRFVVGARRNELAALTPEGEPRWSLPRRDVRSPRWGGTGADTRIAYLSGRSLRVVGGHGRGDRLLVRRAAAVAPAWRPGGEQVVAFVEASGHVRVVEADTRRVLQRSAERFPAAVALAWSASGRTLAVLSRSRLEAVVGSLAPRRLHGEGVAMEAAPSGERFAVVVHDPRGDRSELLVDGRTVFVGAGRFSGVDWSPDGRWLLVAWRDADQWLFLRSAGVRRVAASSAISTQFRSEAFPRLEGWCCP